MVQPNPSQGSSRGRVASNPSLAAHVAVWLALVFFLVALALMAWGASNG